jgi:hypothetical protein
LRLKNGRRTWLGATEIYGGAAERNYAGGEKGLTCGGHMLVTGKEKMCFGGMCKHEGKTPFGEYAKPSQTGLAEQGDGGL